MMDNLYRLSSWMCILLHLGAHIMQLTVKVSWYSKVWYDTLDRRSRSQKAAPAPRRVETHFFYPPSESFAHICSKSIPSAILRIVKAFHFDGATPYNDAPRHSSKLWYFTRTSCSCKFFNFSAQGSVLLCITGLFGSDTFSFTCDPLSRLSS